MYNNNDNDKGCLLTNPLVPADVLQDTHPLDAATAAAAASAPAPSAAATWVVLPASYAPRMFLGHNMLAGCSWLRAAFVWTRTEMSGML